MATNSPSSPFWDSGGDYNSMFLTAEQQGLGSDAGDTNFSSKSDFDFTSPDYSMSDWMTPQYDWNSSGYGDFGNGNDGFTSGYDDGNYANGYQDDNKYNRTSADRASMYGNGGYGQGITGQTTNAFDKTLNFTGSKDAAYGMSKVAEGLQPFQKYVNNPIISTLMSLNPITAGLKAVVNGPQGIGGALGSMIGAGAGPLGGMLGGLAGSKAGEYVSTGNMTGLSGGTVGSMLGGGVGSQFGGYGGLLGSLAGGALGKYAQNSGEGFQQGTGSYGFPQGMNGSSNDINSSLLGGLAGLYLGNRANVDNTNQINNLNGLFSQNSPYSQQMRQALERRDAAAGRRSQYGNREVELQAALATQAARSAPQIQQLTNQKTQNRNLMLATLLRNAGVQNLARQGFNGLSDLFTSTPVANNGFTNGYDDSNIVGEG